MTPVGEQENMTLKSATEIVKSWKKVRLPKTAQPMVDCTNAASEGTRSSAMSAGSAALSQSALQQMVLTSRIRPLGK